VSLRRFTNQLPEGRWLKLIEYRNKPLEFYVRVRRAQLNDVEQHKTWDGKITGDGLWVYKPNGALSVVDWPSEAGLRYTEFGFEFHNPLGCYAKFMWTDAPDDPMEGFSMPPPARTTMFAFLRDYLPLGTILRLAYSNNPKLKLNRPRTVVGRKYGVPGVRNQLLLLCNNASQRNAYLPGDEGLVMTRTGFELHGAKGRYVAYDFAN
jgi:hypothetical protein